jgi:hypothetical protein
MDTKEKLAKVMEEFLDSNLKTLVDKGIHLVEEPTPELKAAFKDVLKECVPVVKDLTFHTKCAEKYMFYLFNVFSPEELQEIMNDIPGCQCMFVDRDDIRRETNTELH